MKNIITDLPPILPENLQSDRQMDLGVLVARGALALSVVLFIGSLAATLTVGGGGQVLGETAGREEINVVDFQAHLDAIKAEYGSDFASATEAVSNKTALDDAARANYTSRLAEFRSELTALRVPEQSQEEVLRMAADIDGLLDALSQ